MSTSLDFEWDFTTVWTQVTGFDVARREMKGSVSFLTPSRIPGKGRSIQHVQSPRLELRDPEALLDPKLPDVAMPNWNAREVQFESLDRMIVLLNSEQFPEPGHAVTE
jgi:hypothetical protein